MFLFTEYSSGTQTNSVDVASSLILFTVSHNIVKNCIIFSFVLPHLMQNWNWMALKENQGPALYVSSWC